MKEILCADPWKGLFKMFAQSQGDHVILLEQCVQLEAYNY